MAVGKLAARVRHHKSIAGAIVPRSKPCPVGDSLFANVRPAVRALVRAAQRSADKTVFVDGVEHERMAAVAEDAGYLAPLGALDGVFRITARGEAYLAAWMRAD